MRFLLPVVLCLGALTAQVKAASAFDKPTLEAYVRHLLALSPDVLVKIDDPKPSPMAAMKEVDVHLSLGGRSQEEVFYVSADGKNILRGSIFDISKNPFQEDLDKIKTDQAPVFGKASAPVTIVVYSDFQCPNCKEEAKVFRDNIPGKFPNEVKLYFKDFPLEAIHPWAKTAAIDGQCVYRESPAAFWKFHDWIYEHQGEITPENLKDKVLEWGKTTSEMDMLQLGRCVENRSTEAGVDKEIAEGHTLRIDGTPTTFINGRRLFGNYPWANLEQIIYGELKYKQAQQAAAEKCCEITIPSPLKK